MNRRCVLAFLLALGATLAPGAALAQEPAPAPAAPGIGESTLALSLKLAREAMAAGDAAAAYGHLSFALERSENPLPVLELLLRNAAGAADAQILWAHDLARLLVDPGGRVMLPSGVREAMPLDDPHPVAVAKARADAVREIVKLRAKLDGARKAGSTLLVEWLEDLGRELAAGSPALIKAHGAVLSPTIAQDQTAQKLVMRELTRTIRAALAQGDAEVALRAARCLKGIAVQAGLKDLEGPEPPSVKTEMQAANDGIGRARGILVDRTRVYTQAELMAMSYDEQRAFTTAHGSFGDPGTTYSPQGWYRVETSCGWETLTGAADTVELHHQRLVNWYGQDPFKGRPGILRVVPESHGLEMEGAPFWWVGGFQGGDTTTIKFTIGTIPGMGRILTHELTHRFDGQIYGGLPAWLGEGKAVWTGGAYGSMHDENFVPQHASFGTMTQTANMGYGGQGKLEKLIAGTVEEYRDNYPAGYSLYLFLDTWIGLEGDERQGEPLFHDRLMRFQTEDRRRKGDPLEVFAWYFADGKEGRPDGLEEFTEEFAAFLRGFYWKDPAPWRDRYTQSTPPGDEATTVLDEPTWTWQRGRAEPWFGQEQARVAGELLAEQNRDREAVLAFTWSFAVDEPSAATQERVGALLEKLGDRDAAWAVRHWPRLDSPRYSLLPLEPAPFLDDLDDVRAYRSALAAAAQAAFAAGHRGAAAALAADHDALSARLGLPALGLPLHGADWRGLALLHPFSEAPQRAGRDGWTEAGLTGHEDRRVPGLWFVDDQDDVHVGRKEARGGTDTMDRTAHWRDAFVLSEGWQDPGRYRISTRIEMTTSYASAGIAFGWTRRDRNYRFDFTGGDYQYAIGEEDVAEDLQSVRWGLSTLFARGGNEGGAFHFGREKNFFAVDILVDGPTAELWIDGEPVGVVTAVDGRPIEGRIGLFTSHGAIRASAPLVQRLDRERFAADGSAPGGGLDPHRNGELRWRDLLRRPVTGVPLANSGTVLMWFPDQGADKLEAEGEEGWIERVRERVESLVVDLEYESPSQGLTLMVPQEFPAAGREALLAEFAARLPGGLAIGTHAMPVELEESGRTIQGWAPPILAFIDPVGILQYAERHKTFSEGLPEKLLHQLLIHQDHRRPGQAGPAE
ncbi:MAG TPA: hypothetical protein VGC54_02410 [Planctomycetota bacterium]